MKLPRFFLCLLACAAPLSCASASAPTIFEAASKGNPNGFNLTFSEPVDPATATNTLNYQIDQGVNVLGASLLYGTNQTTIVVHTTDLTGTGPYTVTVNGVKDQAVPANEIAPNSMAIIRRASGAILNRGYGAINGGQPLGGSLLVNLTNDSPRFPDRPDLVELRPELSIVPYRTNNYGSQLIGYLEAPETGEYRFLIAARDQAVLYLGTGASAGSKRPIAGEPQFGWGGPRQYFEPNNRTYNSVGGSEQQSWVAGNFPNRLSNDAFINDSISAYGSITLEAGKRYYIEALVKSGGFDWLDIAWQRPGDAAVTNGQPAIEGIYLSPGTSFYGGPVEIVRQPEIYSINEGGFFETYAAHAGMPPYDYQWFRDGVPVAGATSFRFRADFVNMDDDGEEFRVRIRNAFSEVTSEPAVLNIIPDTEAPTVVRAEGSHQFDRVVLTFSESLDPITATTVGNYQVVPVAGGPDLPVLEAVVRPLDTPNPFGRSQIVLRTASQSPGIRYRVTLANLRDRAAPPHPLASPLQIDFTAWVLSSGFLHLEVFPLASAEQLDTFDFDALPNVPAPLGFVTRYVNSAEDSHNYPGLSRLLGRLMPSARETLNKAQFSNFSLG